MESPDNPSNGPIMMNEANERAFNAQAQANQSDPGAEFAYDSSQDESSSSCSTCSSTSEGESTALEENKNAPMVRPQPGILLKAKKRKLEDANRDNGADADYEWSGDDLNESVLDNKSLKKTEPVDTDHQSNPTQNFQQGDKQDDSTKCTDQINESSSPVTLLVEDQEVVENAEVANEPIIEEQYAKRKDHQNQSLSTEQQVNDSADSDDSSNAEDLALALDGAEIKSGSEDEGPPGRVRKGGGGRDKDELRWPKDYIPNLPDMTDLDSIPIHKAGNIHLINQMQDLESGWLVLIKAVAGLSNDPASTADSDKLKTDTPLTLDYGSVLCTSNRTVIGAIADVVGRVGSPMYVLGFRDDQQINELGLQQESEIFYFPKYAKSVFPGQLMNVGKASDASALADREADEDIAFSDDEKERYYKSKGKKGYKGGIMEKVKLELEEWNAGRNKGHVRSEDYNAKKMRRDWDAPPKLSLPAGPPAFGTGLPPKPPQSVLSTAFAYQGMQAVAGAPEMQQSGQILSSSPPISGSSDTYTRRGSFRGRGPSRGRGRGGYQPRSPKSPSSNGHRQDRFTGPTQAGSSERTPHNIIPDPDASGGYHRLQRPLEYSDSSPPPPQVPPTQQQLPITSMQETNQAGLPQMPWTNGWNNSFPPNVLFNTHNQSYQQGRNHIHNQMQNSGLQWGQSGGGGAAVGYTLNGWTWNGSQYVPSSYWHQHQSQR